MNRLLHAFGATLLIQLSGMLTGVVAARLLGPAGRGTLAEITSWALGLAALGCLSINAAVVYFAAKSGTAQEQSRVLGTALTVAAGTSAVTLCIAAGLIAAIYVGTDGALWTAIVLGLLAIPLFHFGYVLTPMLQTLGSARTYALVRITPAVVGAAFAVMFLLTELGRTVEWYLGASVVASSAAIAVCVLGLRRLRVAVGRPNRELAAKLVAFAVRSHPAAIGGQRENIDRLVLAAFVPAAALGQYAVAATLPAILLALASTLDLVLFPRLALSREPEQARALFGRAARLATLVLALAAILLAVASLLFVPLLFGDEYDAASRLGPIMCATYFLVGARLVIGSGFVGFGQPFRHSRGDVVVLGVSMVAIPLGAAAGGVEGAAWAALLAQFAAFGLALASLKAGIGISAREVFRYGAADLAFLKTMIPRARV
ncbi:MAG TPA: oligosaccharide flippase family protein [Sphingomonadaceae bacterium]|nr:oligosaccharide flippase family protein [Sphingomonadaceae bacterium]